MGSGSSAMLADVHHIQQRGDLPRRQGVDKRLVAVCLLCLPVCEHLMDGCRTSACGTSGGRNQVCRLSLDHPAFTARYDLIHDNSTTVLYLTKYNRIESY